MGIRVSGNAIFNGINFSSSGVDVKVRQTDKGIVTYTNYSFPGILGGNRKKGLKSRVDLFLLTTPFIRGPYSILKMVKKAWKLLLPMMAICFVFVGIIMLFSPSLKEAVLTDTLTGSSELYLQGSLLMLILAFFYLSPVSKYHGAEHKAINALLNNPVVTMENIRRASRVSVNCGTVYVFLVFIIYPILTLLMDSHWALLMAISVGYELFRAEQRWLMYILKPIYLLALGLQKHVTTREPDEKHLMAAYSGISKVQNSAILIRALKHIDGKRFCRADEMIDGLISIDGRNPVNRFYKAYSLFKQGKFGEAKEYIETYNLKNSKVSKDVINHLVGEIERKLSLTS